MTRVMVAILPWKDCPNRRKNMDFSEEETLSFREVSNFPVTRPPLLFFEEVLCIRYASYNESRMVSGNLSVIVL